jgi:hypothetical protein
MKVNDEEMKELRQSWINASFFWCCSVYRLSILTKFPWKGLQVFLARVVEWIAIALVVEIVLFHGRH